MAIISRAKLNYVVAHRALGEEQGPFGEELPRAHGTVTALGDLSCSLGAGTLFWRRGEELRGDGSFAPAAVTWGHGEPLWSCLWHGQLGREARTKGKPKAFSKKVSFSSRF